jgi:alpha-N-acetylglucosamine transferase
VALHVVVWRWGTKYKLEYLHRLQNGLDRHLKEPFIFRIERPLFEDEYLTKIPGCFCRLRMFDPQWQRDRGMVEGDRIVSIDLDVVITGPLDPLFYRPEKFVILHGANASNPCFGLERTRKCGTISH